MQDSEYKYLYRVDSPEDLQKLSLAELPLYCGELRRFIVGNLAHTPGHLGSSLGAVELNVALHYVFDAPRDKIIWDVGHQAYAHKIITGRRDLFPSLRKLGGIAGFPRPEESPYDAFTGGHASVSISAALGMAIAGKRLGNSGQVVAVIGDGAMTGGLAFEGLNNAGVSNSDLLVVLNDNRIAIDRNAGAIREYLVGITTSRRYNRLKTRIWNMFPPGSRLHNLFKKTANAVKHGLLQQSNLFESFGFRYFGPVDGNDVVSLVKVLRDLKEIGGPKLLHTMTVKGKGYAPAENDQAAWHAPGRYDALTGHRECTECAGTVRWQDAFGGALLELAKADERIVGITPAMPTGSSLNLMMDEMPERTFDVGIAEGHAVTFAAGLASAGMVPFCAIYSSFAQRSYDNIIHDVALNRSGVVLCLDRAGLVGEDGTTHQGVFDIAALMPVPGLVIASPADAGELRDLMFTASRAGRPFVIRYPKGNTPAGDICRPFSEVPIGKGKMLRDGSDVAVVTFGPVASFAAEAVERAAERGVSAAHYDLRFAKPLDEELLREIGAKFRRVVTVEDGVLRGGVGCVVEEFLIRGGFRTEVMKLGVGDAFVGHGSQSELYSLCGYDAEGILAAVITPTE